MESLDTQEIELDNCCVLSFFSLFLSFFMVQWASEAWPVSPQVTTKNLIKLASYDNRRVMEGMLGTT